jgi:3D (Asp-Asp-Asp) domain-containing protein
MVMKLSRFHLHAVVLGLLFGLAVAYAEAEAACSQFSVSAYTHTGNRTATGIWPYPGVVAVDPRVIPLGSTVWIAGYGEHLAADTGGAIKGFMLDRFVPSYREAITFGRRVLEACW